MAINLSIFYEKNDVMSDIINNIESCKLDGDWVLSNLSQKKLLIYQILKNLKLMLYLIQLIMIN